MDKCGDCINYHNDRHRQCIAYNNEVSSKDDATHCCEFENRKTVYLAAQSIDKIDAVNKGYHVIADCVLENGEYCWQECCETEHCKECRWLGNGDTIWFEQMQKGEENEKGNT